MFNSSEMKYICYKEFFSKLECCADQLEKQMSLRANFLYTGALVTDFFKEYKF